MLRKDDQKSERFRQNLRKNVHSPKKITKYLGIESTFRVVGFDRDSQWALNYSVPNTPFRVFDSCEKHEILN
jgi:hypothetical protein